MFIVISELFFNCNFYLFSCLYHCMFCLLCFVPYLVFFSFFIFAILYPSFLLFLQLLLCHPYKLAFQYQLYHDHIIPSSLCCLPLIMLQKLLLVQNLILVSFTLMFSVWPTGESITISVFCLFSVAFLYLFYCIISLLFQFQVIFQP